MCNDLIPRGDILMDNDRYPGSLTGLAMNASEDLAMRWTKAQPFVAGYVSSLVPNFHAAEDILQQVAVVLVRKFDQYDPAQPFLSWALGVARREVLKQQRQMARDRHIFTDDLAERIQIVYQRLSDELEGYSAWLADCLKGLDNRTRQALDLRYVDDLQPSDVAMRMGMTPGATRVLLYRARIALQKCIELRMGEQKLKHSKS